MTKNKSNYFLKIGDLEHKYKGFKTYKISYTYIFDKDKNKNYDELVYSLVKGWDTDIKGLNFTINFPQNFDIDNCTMLVSNKEDLNLAYYKTFMSIGGYYTGTFKANNSLDINIKLEEGYFTKSSSNMYELTLIGIILVLVAGCVILFLIIKNRRK